MITTALVGAIAAVFTVSTYVNTAGNTANLSYDQQVVGESLAQMNDTAALLKARAEMETDPAKRQQKLLIAQKLSQTHDTMDSLQSKMITRTAKKEFANLTKAVVVGNLDRISQVGEIGGQIAGILDGSLDTAVSLRSGDPQAVTDITLWSKAARSSDGLDVEIAKVKARQQAKDLASLNDDLAAMIRDLDSQEKNGSITSDDYEKNLGEIVQDNPDAFGIDGSDALVGLDKDLSVGDSDNESPNNQYQGMTVEPGQIVGDWVVIKWSDKEPDTASQILWGAHPYRFLDGGKAWQEYVGFKFDMTYDMDKKGQGMLEIVGLTDATADFLSQDVVQERFVSRIGEKHCFVFDGAQIFLSQNKSCDFETSRYYILEPRQ